jgi:hypothetical protein
MLLVAASLFVGAIAVQARPPHHQPEFFSISGDVDGLYPGVDTTLQLTITRIRKVKVVVRSIDVQSVGVDRAGCPVSAVSSPGWEGRERLLNRRTVTIDVPISMSYSAPDACQGATFALHYEGEGTKK